MIHWESSKKVKPLPYMKLLCVIPNIPKLYLIATRRVLRYLFLCCREDEGGVPVLFPFSLPPILFEYLLQERDIVGGSEPLLRPTLYIDAILCSI